MKKKNYSQIKKKSNINRISLSITCNRTLPKIYKNANRNWNIIQNDNEFKGVFQSKPIRVFECPKNLGEIIVGQTIKQGKFFKKILYRLNGKSKCLAVRLNIL